MSEDRKASERIVVRFTEEQKERIKRASAYRGRTMAILIQDATLAELDIIEAEMRHREAERQRPRPTGLGLNRPNHPIPRQTPTVTPSTAVPPLPPSRPPILDLDRFVAYVLDAPEGRERNQRVDTVLEIIASSTTSQKEAKEIARLLDERVKARMRERRAS